MSDTPYITAESGLSTRTRLLAALIALCLIGGIVGAAVVAADGGGNSPEDAVRQLVTAAEQRDGLALVEALLPTERDALRAPLKDITAELKRLQVIKADTDLRKVPGVDIRVTGLTLSTQKLADNVADVSVTGGKITGTTDAKQLAGTAIKSEVKPQTQTVDLASKHIVLAMVRSGDRWYVSLAYSLAEAARRDAKQPPPPFGHGVAAKGSNSPEDAVRDAVQAGTNLDVRRLIELTPPDEAAALHDYAPLFIADAEKASADARPHGPKVEVTKLDLTSAAVAEDRARVSIKGFEANWTAGGEHRSVTWDGKCVTITPPPTDVTVSCADGTSPTGLPPNFTVTVTTVRRDGQWYISPVGTIADVIVQSLRALPSNAFTTGSPFAGLFGALVGGASVSSSSSTSGSSFGSLEPASTTTTTP